MRHIFVINPTAGKQDMTRPLTEKINALELEEGDSAEIITTKAPGHATEETRKLAATGEEMRFYACGGDGSLFEVVNGVFDYKNCSIGSIPTGSGNDFIKSFPTIMKEKFLDLAAMVKGKLHTIDSLTVGKYHSLNIVSAGFDAAVCKNMVKYKNLPLVNGKWAYNLGLIDGVIAHRRNYFKLVADGAEIEDGTHPYLFAIAANGRYYGGGFKASPLSDLTDGLLNLITVPSVPVVKFAGLIGLYRKGEHIDSPKMPFVKHSLGKSLKICSPDTVPLNIDGEIIMLDNPEIVMNPMSVKIILPE